METLKSQFFDYWKRDVPAGIITGLMAIPLTIGICLMSEYPILTGLYTVIFACLVSFVTYLFRPGNFVGVPGIAAGLAPVLALSIHKFGIQNMPFLIFLTSVSQAIVWRFNLQKYLLKAVPHYLVEGLLAGIGLKIALKFLPYTFETLTPTADWLSSERIRIMLVSVGFMLLFLYLFKKYRKTSPGIPYLVVIAASVFLSFYIHFPMLHIEPTPLVFALPIPNFNTLPPSMWLQLVGYAFMLSTIDIIEQVMSNAAIEKMDPLGRKCNTNNSLLAIWVANLGSSFFGGMTNLDGLAKSTTNATAGAVTKLSNIITGLVILLFALNSSFLEYLPEFSLAVLMIFSGWKMMAGIYHVASEGKYAFMLSLFCGILVFKLGIFEGLLIALAVHSIITYVIYKHDQIPTIQIIKKFLQRFSEEMHPHSTHTMLVMADDATGGVCYKSIQNAPSDKKSLLDFIKDWSSGINTHNVLSVVGTYDYQALLWGTFAKELRNGHANIKKYFEHLFELDRLKVEFESAEVRQYKDIFIQSGSYTFSYFKKDELVTVPARYSFVCKKEKTGWYIVEHHSSQFPL